MSDVEIRDPHLREITRLDHELCSAHREIERLNKQLGEVLRENRRMLPVFQAAHDFANSAGDVRDATELRRFIVQFFLIDLTNGQPTSEHAS